VSDHNKWVHIFKVPLSNSKKILEIETHRFSWEIREVVELYLIQQFWSILMTLFNSAVLEHSDGVPGHTGSRYVCAQVHSSDLFLALIIPGLIQVSPLLARRCSKLLLR